MARRNRSKNKFDTGFFDRGRPNSPYVKGSQWRIQSHEPPAPFGVGYKTMHRRGPQAVAKMRQEKLPQSVYCMLNPPSDPEPPFDAPGLQIEVTEELRVRVSQGPQVVACRIIDRNCAGISRKSENHAQELVAKIFDPLYYYYDGKFDIVELADMEYSREAAAYEHLQQEGVDGQLLPGYLGSYALEVPVEEEQATFLRQHDALGNGTEKMPRRRVRLVLTERVEGDVMTFHLVFGDVRQLPPEMRLDAIASAMEAYAKLYFHGVVHGDLAPRNVFLRGRRINDNDKKSKSDELSFLRFVDLGLAYILGRPDSTCPRQPVYETRPRNPIRLFWRVFDSGAANMYYWLPSDLRNTRAFHLWMLRRWYGDKRFEPLGVLPEPSRDDTPWDTGKAAKDCEWPGDKTPETGNCRLSDALSKAIAKVSIKGKVDKGGWKELAGENGLDGRQSTLSENSGKPEHPKGFW